MNCITTKNLNISYGNVDIVKDLNLNIPKGKITTIIGANGCGKSTILKTIGRVITPKSGNIYINGKDIYKENPREIAKNMAILPQSPQAPSGLTVEELIAYGRFPHQKGFGKANDKDKDIVNWALEITGIEEFKDRNIDDLSGGQRQRAWIAMALAQETDILLLDEPTTYLDLAHQLEILKLLEDLNKKQGRTIVMVIHELNNAARFADHMIGIKKGRVVCEGSADEVMTKENLKEIFNIDAEIVKDPRTKKPVCITYDMV
ncbi:Probable siderophore transport system ATP-binding protein YusV [uncultured Clostridium sp.]|uniref:ABC transporter ATP-binding protein n=1 Tax=Paeniclostridium hominis TaxID=2764329 RepID=A0ABR7K4I5_9FIRM|nr:MULTISPECIES: ABC transporter ATP-binding protein [Paeniclostridium]MDU1538924.1 ABC transporter ATP-binding protein [Paeniclostridium sordellii]SCI76007.1 Probable siderophore transport system ATP-binding protein YusV [uncultured Clostridium sp.]MBC6003845.1 ABC transporter ATP-binding protein [Paeniclostridium hominis]MDU2591979.1 ABC transporter ATP-binding protein [Paeniclostridium sordellii]SCJ10004.1 Probable siderophore transport system ATP-binding protein YusV [uncultured Clostridiu